MIVVHLNLIGIFFYIFGGIAPRAWFGRVLCAILELSTLEVLTVL